jgi:hypothetical protein
MKPRMNARMEKLRINNSHSRGQTARSFIIPATLVRYKQSCRRRLPFFDSEFGTYA